jgi:hypothetical protein
MNYYELVQNEIKNGTRIIGIISPPRVVSTAFEILLTESADIDGQINEPFHLSLRTENSLLGSPEERAYEDIYRRIQEVKEKTGKETVTLVMKEMAKNISPNGQMKRLSDILDKKIIIARNPLTSLESLIRRLSDLATKREDLIGFSLNEYAINFGYIDSSGTDRHWDKMLEQVKRTKNYSPINKVIEEFFPNSNLYRFDENMQRAYLELIDDRIAIKSGFNSLNDYAQEKGYESWLDMKTNQNDLGHYSEILDEAFSHRNAGWESIQEHLNLMDDNYVFVDTTILRADPQRTLKEVTDYLDVEYSESMINGWSKSNKDNFDIGHKKRGSSPFIYKALNSTSLNLPDESPITLSSFPYYFHSYIRDVAIPAYLDLLSDEKRVGVKGEEVISSLLESKVFESTKLKNRDPVFAYSVIATDKNIEDATKENELVKIRKKFNNQFGDIFDSIDKHLSINLDRSLFSKPHFQNRNSNAYIPVVDSCCLHEELKDRYDGEYLNLKIYAAVKGNHKSSIEKYQSNDDLPQTLKGKKAGEEVTFKDQCMYAIDVCNTLVNKDYISKLVNKLIERPDVEKDKTTRINIVFPQPVFEGQTRNVLSIAFARKLVNELNKRFCEIGYDAVVVAADFHSLKTLTKAGRGNINPTNGDLKKKLSLVGRMARQHLFDGFIKEGELYGIVDDSIFSQSTAKNMHDCIHIRGGNVAFIATLSHGIGSCDMNLNQSSVRLLEDILKREEISLEDLNEVLSDKRLFGENGFRFDGSNNTNLTNIEVLTLASYFGNKDDKKNLEQAILSIGLEKDEIAVIEKSDLFELLQLEKGGVKELKEIFEQAVKQRKLLSKNIPNGASESKWLNRVIRTVIEQEKQFKRI